MLLGVLIVLYIGTQLAASLVTALSADPTQRRIMLALPFVFAIFIVNFEAGLIVYWITTNVWTIGQQLLVKKLYPKPEPREPSDDDGDATAGARQTAAHRRRRRGEPKAPAGKGRRGEGPRPSAAPATAPASKPPPNPRKKKKRSGRRR